MGNQPSIAAAGANAPPALVWGLDGEEALAAAGPPPLDASGSGSSGRDSGSGGSNSNGGNSSSSSNDGTAPLDFGALFVDGEPWAEAQQRAAFLSRVQRRLLDPAFVAPLQLEEGRRAEEVG